MPQFDFYSFSGQTFWFLTFFFLFYFFTLYYYITFFSEVIKLRKKLNTFVSSLISKQANFSESKKLFEVYLNKTNFK